MPQALLPAVRHRGLGGGPARGAPHQGRQPLLPLGAAHGVDAKRLWGDSSEMRGKEQRRETT